MAEMTVVIIVCIAATVGVVYTAITGKPDNIVEEVAEEVIKDETGIKVDLTPSSPEK